LVLGRSGDIVKNGFGNFRVQLAPGMVGRKASLFVQARKAVTADLDVPTFTKNVKVGQPPS
jgi:hypothetical protein